MEVCCGGSPGVIALVGGLVRHRTKKSYGFSLYYSFEGGSGVAGGVVQVLKGISGLEVGFNVQ